MESERVRQNDGSPVPFTPDAVIAAFNTIPDLLARAEALTARGRWLDVDCLLGPSTQPFHLAIRAGRIVDMAPAPVLMRSWRFAYRATPAAFAASAEVADAEADHARSETITETIEELRFYLAHSMVEQARLVFAKLEKLKPGADKLAAVQQEIEVAEAQTSSKPPEVVEEFSVDEADEIPAAQHEEFKIPVRPIAPAPAPAMTEYAQASPQAEPAGVLGEFVSDLEASLGDSFLPPPPAAPAPHEQPALARESRTATPGHIAAAAAPAPAKESPAPAATPAPTFTYQPTKKRTLAPEVAAAAPQAAAASVDLADMFGELKHELEDDSASAQEDPETHYNLGVAFREMGLLDEAIGELQKVCQAVDRGHSFPQLMQTYTWLAQCFLDKGVAEAAIRWYEKALKLPHIDEETRTALNYELASSYEAAGNKTAALNYFTEVYGTNIDYRDVGERIKALKS